MIKWVFFQDLSQLKSLVEKDSTKLSESKSAKRLSSAVNRMINNLSTITDDLHKQKQQLMEEIEVSLNIWCGYLNCSTMNESLIGVWIHINTVLCLFSFRLNK